MGTPSGSRHPLFARCYSALALLAESAGAKTVRQELLGGLSGRVLEIGGGNGLNLRHYPTSVDQVTVIEPERHLRSRCERAAQRARVKAVVLDGFAESLPFENASFDAAVSSLVLCSVTDLGLALAELMRVLRPQGELRFYEHIRGHRRAGHLQDAVDPLWGLIAGGCHLNRETVVAMERAGFLVGQVRSVPIRVAGVPVPGPEMVLGRAVRP
ncbi:MAG: class I SAM-dependent methyltransferase [Candidatus Dormibacteria bacterium]